MRLGDWTCSLGAWDRNLVVLTAFCSQDFVQSFLQLQGLVDILQNFHFLCATRKRKLDDRVQYCTQWEIELSFYSCQLKTFFDVSKFMSCDILESAGLRHMRATVMWDSNPDCHKLSYNVLTLPDWIRDNFKQAKFICTISSLFLRQTHRKFFTVREENIKRHQGIGAMGATESTYVRLTGMIALVGRLLFRISFVFC